MTIVCTTAGVPEISVYHPNMHNKVPHQIWFLVSAGSPPLDVTGPFDVFRQANRLLKNKNADGEERSDDDGYTTYDLKVVSASNRIVQSACGLNVVADQTLAEAAGQGLPQTVIVCGSAVPIIAGSDEAIFADWLKDHSQQIPRICSVCSGAFILGRAGILNERNATTHWKLLKDLKKTFPSVNVVENTLFVHDNNVWTSAGVLSGIDMALMLVQEDLGHLASYEVAKFLVMFLRRSGNQTQHSLALAGQVSERDALRELQPYIAERLNEDLSVEHLAEVVHMSPRNLSRVFKNEIGISLGKFVRNIRLEESCRLLECTDLSITQIATRVGVKDESTLRRWFVDQFGISPKQFRERCKPSNAKPTV